MTWSGARNSTGKNGIDTAVRSGTCQPAGDARIGQQLLEQRGGAAVWCAAHGFTMHAVDQRFGHRFPVLNERPQLGRIEHQPKDVRWRRLGGEIDEQAEKPRRGVVGEQDVPGPDPSRRLGRAPVVEGCCRARGAPVPSPALTDPFRDTSGRSQRRAGGRCAPATARRALSPASGPSLCSASPGRPR